MPKCPDKLLSGIAWACVPRKMDQQSHKVKSDPKDKNAFNRAWVLIFSMILLDGFKALRS